MRKFTAILLFTFVILFASVPVTQSIHGEIRDEHTGLFLSGANIVITDLETMIGTNSDADGIFHLYKIPVGRHRLMISYIGYETVYIDQFFLSSGKSPYLEIEMREKAIKMDQVTVTAEKKKFETENNFIDVSARSFDIEQTERYAGSLGDPARMARNFAGVVPVRDDRNDIIIRGNSPTGLSWRLNDVEIPNPNHYGGIGLTGGVLTLLNNNLLSSSDFLTGAFPAEYGNALSGVFDLNLRKANPSEKDLWIQMGWNGCEVGVEGPLSRSGNAAGYAVYRYSMLALMDKLGLEQSMLPEYQDLTTKIDLKTKKFGNWSLWAIGGLSTIDIFESSNYTEGGVYTGDWQSADTGEDLTNSSNSLISSLSNQYLINPKASLHTTVSNIINKVTTRIDTFSIASDTLNKMPYYEQISLEIKTSLRSELSYKFSPNTMMKTGAQVDHIKVDYDEYYDISGDQILDQFIDESGSFNLLRAYSEVKQSLFKTFILHGGLYAQYFDINDEISFEPRLSFRWQPDNLNLFSAGTGLYSRTQPYVLYFVEYTDAQTGTTIKPNIDMQYTKAWHAAVSYTRNFSESTIFKLEGYYQYLFNVPVANVNEGTYSVLNTGSDYYLPRVYFLENTGKGKNYGLEITLEKFFSNNYYFLTTTTLFDSKYTGYDGVERNTAFNSNYIINALGGYELPLGKSQNTLSLDLKSTYHGGKRYVPVNEAASIAADELVYDYDHAFEDRYEDYFRIDLRLTFKMNTPKFYQEFALDLQNLFNRKNVYSKSYDLVRQEYINSYHSGFSPMFTWKMQL